MCWLRQAGYIDLPAACELEYVRSHSKLSPTENSYRHPCLLAREYSLIVPDLSEKLLHRRCYQDGYKPS